MPSRNQKRKSRLAQLLSLRKDKKPERNIDDSSSIGSTKSKSRKKRAKKYRDLTKHEKSAAHSSRTTKKRPMFLKRLFRMRSGSGSSSDGSPSPNRPMSINGNNSPVTTNVHSPGKVVDDEFLDAFESQSICSTETGSPTSYQVNTSPGSDHNLNVTLNSLSQSGNWNESWQTAGSPGPSPSLASYDENGAELSEESFEDDERRAGRHGESSDHSIVYYRNGSLHSSASDAESDEETPVSPDPSASEFEGNSESTNWESVNQFCQLVSIRPITDGERIQETQSLLIFPSKKRSDCNLGESEPQTSTQESEAYPNDLESRSDDSSLCVPQNGSGSEIKLNGERESGESQVKASVSEGLVQFNGESDLVKVSPSQQKLTPDAAAPPESPDNKTQIAFDGEIIDQSETALYEQCPVEVTAVACEQGDSPFQDQSIEDYARESQVKVGDGNLPLRPISSTEFNETHGLHDNNCLIQGESSVQAATATESPDLSNGESTGESLLESDSVKVNEIINSSECSAFDAEIDLSEDNLKSGTNLTLNSEAVEENPLDISSSNAEFNQWQFWRFVTDYDLPVLTQEILVPEAYCDLNENYISVTTTEEDLDYESEPEPEPCPYYILTACTECSEFGTNKPITQFNSSAGPPQSFWASGLNFCGHPRLLVLQSSTMGNQPGKEKDASIVPAVPKKSKLGMGILRRGDTKTSLPIVPTSTATTTNTTTTTTPSIKPTGTGTGKSRAPPPPTLSTPSRPNNTGSDLVRVETGVSAVGTSGSGTTPDEPTFDEDLCGGSRRSSITSGNYNNLSTTGNYYGSDREPSLDGDISVSDNSSLTLADTYQTAINGLSNTGSYYSALGILSYNDDGDEDDTLRNHSDQLSIDSIELIMPTAESNGNLSKLDGEDGQVFTTQATSSMGSDLNFNLSQRSMTTTTPFTVTRKRRVELSSVSSPVDDISTSGFIGARRDGTAASEQCLSGTQRCISYPGPSQDDYSTSSLPPAPPRRYNSVSDVPLPESNVLRKVASLTMAELQSQQMLSTSFNKALTKPKFVPEKLDFRIYEKFEGQMLIHWFVSSFEDGNYLKDSLTAQDMKFLANQFCTLLLAAGVLKQIEESEATPVDSIFRPDLIYYWSHSESPAVSCQVPGKLPPVSWPPAQDPGAPNRNGAKYTEAGEGISEGGSRTLSPEHLPEPGTVPKTVSHFESECDLTRLSASTNALSPNETEPNPNPEFQQMVIGLKKEHKQVLDKKTAEHELKVFSVRGETQEASERKFTNRILELEKECETLRTLISIQNLTNQVCNDFASPTDEKGSNIPAANIPPPPPPPTAPPPPPMSGMGAPPPPPPPMAGMGGPPPPPPPMAGMGGPPPPPPPMGGPGCPPPPPPMGGPGGPPPPPAPQAVARKQAIQPLKAMKPLYWTRIQIKTPMPAPRPVDVNDEPAPAEHRRNTQPDTDSKLWEKIEELPVTSWDDFTDLFGKQVIEKKEPTIKLDEKPSSQKLFSVLDQKRAQNVGIFVRSNKFEDERRNPDISKIRDAVLELDLSDLSLETVEKIIVLKATDAEYAAMKDHVESNPDLPLDRADKFLYELNSIPKFVERIMCFTFQFTFNESFTMIETKLSNFRLVCEQLMSSKDLKHVIALILTYGNYMNGGNTQRGQADGFTLDILPKLRDVKSNDNSYTFLHFIVSTYIKKFDEKGGTTEAKLPTPEPSDILGAASLNFDEIELDLKKLKEKLKHCDKQAQEVIQSSEEHVEPFKTKMVSFLEQATVKVQDMEENLVEGKQTFIKTMKFFDYMPKAKKAGEICPPSDFFQPWSAFCHDFKEIWKNEQQRILKENLKELERAIQAKRVGISKLQKQPKKKGGLKDKLMEKLNKQRESSN